MHHLRTLTAALALGTALLSSGQMAMAGTLPVEPYARPGFVTIGKPDFAPVDKHGAISVPRHEPKADLPADLFVLGQDGYEAVEFFTGFFYASQAFTVTTAGTYQLTLTDLVFPEPLHKLGATVTTAQDKLTEVFGSGSMLFDMEAGTHYLSYFAKAQTESDPGLFGLTLHYYDGATTPVPVPAALWLLGSGLIGLAGATRGRRLG